MSTLREAVAAAVAVHRAGRYDEAERLYRQLLSENPTDPDLHHWIGIIAHQSGQHERAAQLIERAVRLNGAAPDYRCNLGLVLHAAGRLDEAAASYSRAIELKPDYAEAHNNLGLVLHDLGRYDEAAASLERAIAIRPDYADAHYNLGLALKAQNRLGDAAASYGRAIALRPDYAAAHNNLGVIHQELEQTSEALADYRRAAAADANFTAAHANLAKLLLQVGPPADALDSLLRVFALCRDADEARIQLTVTSDVAETAARVLNTHGSAVQGRGDFAAAARAYRAAITMQPDLADAYSNLGTALKAQGDLEEAVAHYNRAIALRPDYAEAHNNLGVAQYALHQSEQAMASFRRALEMRPDLGEAFNNLGNALLDQTRLEEALASYRRALAVQPNLARAHSNLIFAMSFLPDIDTAGQYAEQRRWYAAHGQALAATIAPHGNDRSPERRLRVGYVSADFYRHSAQYAFGPVLRHHDPAAVEVVCYSGVIKEDDTTAPLRAEAALWRSTLGVADDALAAQIRADAIDILVDLSGHTGGNRLPVFARKPAPVQVSAWGHVAGTGLPTIDALFGDPVVVPIEERPLFAERVVDLPCAIGYEAPPDAPEVAPAPSARFGYVTFGSLNRLAKVNDAVLRVWAEVLKACPGSRLLLKDWRLDEAMQCERVLSVLARHGVWGERVELRGGGAHLDHMAAYADIDIALDPFPHGGGITTCEALWMGVPVVTLAGRNVASRMGASIMTALGLADWAARSEEEYVALAAAKARDVAPLAALRQGLRAKLSASAVGDAARYTRAVETAYRALWRKWCGRAADPDA
ncbi:MAG: tetratricopeptide repeat protein [Proteobacteria bacterium]|nr:tetratricopeptide repeat protein [Pseudomonadota bacterium]